MSRGRRWWPMAVVGFGVFVAADDLMVVATMLRPMINDFDLVVPDDLDRAAWIVNAYLVAYVAVMPVAGKLSDVVGRRAVFVTAMALFAAGSVLIPAADSLGWLYLGRVLTAVGGGALVPVAMAVASDLHQGPARVRALGLLAAIETVGWVWGPLYGAVLVRYASWQWQFHLNVVLAAVGIVAAWLALRPVTAAGAGGDGAEATAPSVPGPGSGPGARSGGTVPDVPVRPWGQVDWVGPGLLTGGLVAANLALLSGARIQSVTGLEQLTGSRGTGLAGPWLYPVAIVLFVAFAWWERRSSDPMVGRAVLGDRSASGALVVNVAVSVGLVIALINVPLFVNIVEGGVEVSAVRSGWLLAAFTGVMAAASYAGGRLAAGPGHDAAPGGRQPVRWRATTLAGLAIAAVGLVTMGLLWDPDTSPWLMAAQLAVTGAGIGLVLAPTSTAVVDAAGDDSRGLASGLVIVARLIGFSVGLAALTAWGLRRYDQLRSTVALPPVDDPGYTAAVAAAAVRVSTSALTETFVGAAAVVAAGLVVAWAAGAGPAAASKRVTTGDGGAPRRG